MYVHNVHIQLYMCVHFLDKEMPWQWIYLSSSSQSLDTFSNPFGDITQRIASKQSDKQSNKKQNEVTSIS